MAIYEYLHVFSDLSLCRFKAARGWAELLSWVISEKHHRRSSAASNFRLSFKIDILNVEAYIIPLRACLCHLIIL